MPRWASPYWGFFFSVSSGFFLLQLYKGVIVQFSHRQIDEKPRNIINKNNLISVIVCLDLIQVGWEEVGVKLHAGKNEWQIYL